MNFQRNINTSKLFKSKHSWTFQGKPNIQILKYQIQASEGKVNIESLRKYHKSVLSGTVYYGKG